MSRASILHGSAEREHQNGIEVAARLTISLVGHSSVLFGGRPVELRTQKAGAILGYLALTETKQESRERLIGLFWSRSDEEKARASLRQVVRELRSAFEEVGYQGFSAKRLSIQLDAENLDVDVENVIRLAEIGSVHPLLLNTARLDEQILEGMDDLDPSFRVWILAKRQTIRDRLMRNLDAGLVASDLGAGAKNEIAAAIVNLDPTHEEACCHLMRMHAEQGDTAGALRIYKALWILLDADYGMEPSQATEELVSKIKLGAFNEPLFNVNRAADRSALGTADIHQAIPLAASEIKTPTRTRLILQPFAMHGMDDSHSDLVHRFHQNLAAALVRFQWKLVDRNSTAVEHQFLDSAPQYCIETTASQGDDSEIKMEMALRESATGNYLWNESFWLSPSYWSEAQRRIIRRVAKSLKVQLSAERLTRLVGEPDVLLDASGRFERAMLAPVVAKVPVKPRLILKPFGMQGIDADRVHLVQGFGLHLAACLVRFREWTVIDRPNPVAPVQLSESIPQYCIESTAYQAGTEINMVMVLRDEATGVYVWSESFRLSLDNWFEAQQRIIRRIATALNVQLSAERLMRLAGEPDVSLDIYDRWLRGQSLMAKFDPESWQRAVAIFRDAILENPSFSPSYSSLVQMNNIEHIVYPGVLPDPQKARVTLGLAKTAVQLDPVDSRAHLCCGWSYVWASQEAEAAPHIELACELNDNDPWTLLSSALYYAFCGSIEQALRLAEQSLALTSAPSNLEWGYHGIIRFLSGDYAGALELIDRAKGIIKTLPAWRTAALFHLGQPDMAREEAQGFLKGIRSSWFGSSASTDEAVVRWALESYPISIRARWEVLRDGLRGAGLPVEDIEIKFEAIEQLIVNEAPRSVGRVPTASRPASADVLSTRPDPLQAREESKQLRHIADLLGGPKVVGKYPVDPLAAHAMLERGLPNTAIEHLLQGVTTLAQKSIESAIGMSVRTRQRREKHPTELLSRDQTGRAWKFAEILIRAISIFGSRSAAEQWLAEPATGLDQRRPIDLLTTPAGVMLVEEFLGRIEHGVYT